MGLSSVATRLATGTYLVQRTQTGTWTKGIYTPGPLTTFNIIASIQPVTGRALEDVPEGQAGREMRVVYTETELRTVTPVPEDASEYGGTGNDPDVIIYKGEPWVVLKAEAWEYFGTGKHWRCYIGRSINELP